jgi:hypothetical protein
MDILRMKLLNTSMKKKTRTVTFPNGSTIEIYNSSRKIETLNSVGGIPYGHTEVIVGKVRYSLINRIKRRIAKMLKS